MGGKMKRIHALRRLQLLKWMVALVIGLACTLSVIYIIERAHTQRTAVRAIEDLGGSVMYDFELQGQAEPPGPRWLRALIGDDYFARVEEVMLWNPATVDADLAPVYDLTHVKKLYLHGVDISDTSVPSLERMHSLERLSLWNTTISDEAKARLRHKLPDCQIF